MDLVEKLRQEQEEMRIAVDRRFAMMEERIQELTKGKEVAEGNAEMWKAEAVRPGNKRENVVLETPVPQSRVLMRSSPANTGSVTRVENARTESRVNPLLKGVVERHKMEVNVLKEMRLTNANGRIEAEKEVERLKEAMAKLEMEKEQRGTNLRNRLEEVAGPSTYKPPCSSSKKKRIEISGAGINELEAFAQQERKNLRKKNKEEIQKI
ncbi:hypothetical protein CBR_g39091 [Chara braunii]|uniref:Uncharacterized protein n=1 Tax=Chara braunii TaxID=69332 RepID=A0A388LR30_CHABU|nr:hypothetical protein CBR_g39091 [Chara braunii]|eukprot:GBG84715.1 hypothetical protein CBR_g39091 [Chara braunii]